MAYGGTGLPSPDSGNVLTQPPPSADAERFTNAQAWGHIAAAGEKLAKSGGDLMNLYEHQRQVGHLARVENESDLKMIDAENQFRDDPKGFLNWAQSYRDGVVSESEPWAVDHVQNHINQRSNTVYSRLLHADNAKQSHVDSQEMTININTKGKDYVDAAAMGEGDSPNGQIARAGFLNAVETAKNARLISPALADHKIKEIELGAEDAKQTRYFLGVYKDKGYDAALEEAKGILQSPAIKSSFDRQTVYDNAVAKINKVAREDDRVIKQVTGSIDNVRRLAADGYSPAPSSMDNLRTTVEQTGHSGLADYLKRTEEMLPVIDSWKKMNPVALQESIGALEKHMQTDGATETGLALKKSGEALLKKMQTEIKRDQLGWADRTEVMSVPRIDFSKPDAVVAMQDRIARAETVAKHFGTTPQYLRPDEVQALQLAANGGGDKMLQVAHMIADGFGDRAPQVMSEVSKESSTLAHIGSLASVGGSPQFQMDVAETVKLRNDAKLQGVAIKLPQWMNKPPEKVMAAQRSNASDVFGNAFVQAQDVQRTVESAAADAYFARAFRTPSLSPVLDNSAGKTAHTRALQESAGATFTKDGTQYGGVGSIKPGMWTNYKVVVPSNVRADRFSDVIGAIKNEDLQALPTAPVSASGKAYTARDIQTAIPVATSGGYRFAMGEPGSDDPKWIRGADGKPWVLDLESLTPVLQRRVPGAFSGAR